MVAKKMSVSDAQAVHRSKYPPLPKAKLRGPRFELKRGKEGYPDALMRIDDPPQVIYGIGNKDALQDGLSIIGARKATPYGKAAARQFAQYAAQRGIPIISGGALGCDTQAHEGALAGKGQTVVVLGGGCNQLYPASNTDLFQRVIDGGGAVISEQLWDFPPLPYTFRARNRIIAGLSRATLIVEAGLPSGTFSTADDALASGREVLAVPGSITSATSRGANRLIYQGATPIIDNESFEDVLVGIFGFLRMQDTRKDAGNRLVSGAMLPDDTDPVLKALYANPMRIEQMLTLPWDERPQSERDDLLTWLMVKLASYERDGLIARFPDGRYGPAQV